MERFLKRHEGRIKGSIHGFDRVLFKGTLRSISYSSGLEKWLASQDVLQKDFSAFSQELTAHIVEKAKEQAGKQGRIYQHVQSPKVSKEDIALRIAKEEQIHAGLVCILSCVEPCRSFKLTRLSPVKKHFGMRSVDRKCLFLYFYFLDQEFGLMHVRLQTWLPFTIQVCVNGWEWLARQLDRAGIPYEKRDNCFTDIADIEKAQQCMNQFPSLHLRTLLNHFARIANPYFCRKNPLDLQPYYWSIRQCEYSTDVIFNSAQALQEAYPALLDHAIHNFHCKDVLHFLQRRICSPFDGEIKTEFKLRVEGTRIKHWVQENSIKMYDKQGSVLRVETTINNPRRWKVWRRATRKGQQTWGWIPMRKGIADIRRRVEVSRTANARYLDALSVVGECLPARQVLDPLAKRIIHDNRSYRPLHAVEPRDAAVLSTIASGEFLIQGFRNKDLLPLLNPHAEIDPSERRKASQKISRTLRLLKEHRLIFKVQRAQRYRLTRFGLTVTATISKLREINLSEKVA